jgi:hypothetical protein
MLFKMEVLARNSIGISLLLLLTERYIGYCVGARDLTWSYVAFQTASDARQRLIEAANDLGGIQNEPFLLQDEIKGK